MRGLLPFKLLYAIRLGDLGFLASSAAYLKAIVQETEELKNLEASTGRKLLHSAFMRMLEDFSDRLLRSHYAGSKEEALAEAEARARRGLVGRAAGAAEALLSSIGSLLGGRAAVETSSNHGHDDSRAYHGDSANGMASAGPNNPTLKLSAARTVRNEAAPAMDSGGRSSLSEGLEAPQPATDVTMAAGASQSDAMRSS